MTGIASQADPADERFETPCPDCNGSGGQFVFDAYGVACHTEPCERCDGDAVVGVSGDEVVTVDCPRCDGDGGYYDEFPDGERWVDCPRCDGKGKLTGPADEVCS